MIKKELITTIIILVTSIIASSLFGEFLPDFPLKSAVIALIVVGPFGIYTGITSIKKRNRIIQTVKNYNDFISNVSNDTTDPFERVMLDFDTKNFKEYFRYMRIEDTQVYLENDIYKFMIKGNYNVNYKDKELELKIIFDKFKISYTINNNYVNKSYEVVYSEKQMYKTLEKHICTTINSLK